MDISQSSIMISYNSTWSILIQWIRVMIVRWQSDLVKKEKEYTLFVITLSHEQKKSTKMGGH